MAERNYVGELNELCQKQRWVLDLDVHGPQGQSHCPIIPVTGSVRFGSSSKVPPLLVRAEGANKKLARQEAANQILLRIEGHVTSHSFAAAAAAAGAGAQAVDVSSDLPTWEQLQNDAHHASATGAPCVNSMRGMGLLPSISLFSPGPAAAHAAMPSFSGTCTTPSTPAIPAAAAAAAAPPIPAAVASHAAAAAAPAPPSATTFAAEGATRVVNYKGQLQELLAALASKHMRLRQRLRSTAASPDDCDPRCFTCNYSTEHRGADHVWQFTTTVCVALPEEEVIVMGAPAGNKKAAEQQAAQAALASPLVHQYSMSLITSHLGAMYVGVGAAPAASG